MNLDTATDRFSCKDELKKADLFLTECFKVKHIFIKRVFDLSFSLLALFFLSPLLLLIAVLIKLTSKGPILFQQERIGRGGKPFICYKFRTMYADAEFRLSDLLNSCSLLKKEWEDCRKLKNDPRITTLGLLLRKTSLDELPQFFNVLKGDLSVVGPRPVVKDEIISYFGEKAYKILSIRPGITGIWQVSGRNDTSYDERIAMDEKYVDTRTFLLDLKLIIKTVYKVFNPSGAY